MILLVGFMLAFSLGGVTAAVSYFISQDIRASSEENNLVINSRTTSDVENRLSNAFQTANMFLELRPAVRIMSTTPTIITYEPIVLSDEGTSVKMLAPSGATPSTVR